MLNKKGKSMKVEKQLGLNSKVTLDGVKATVTGLDGQGLTLTNDKTGELVTMSLGQALINIREKVLEIVKV
tara:strand:+ start:270 stop:482 length:213 start_codon:yes stop_codon:yes gene_type:complete